jgi:membrane-bound lytic murein transglycosylase B
MQFMPGTFAIYGVDGDHDGRASITSDADSIYSAANYLTKSGATTGPAGVRRALFAYNHADWYVNDVLHYAHAYAADPADTTDCTN